MFTNLEEAKKWAQERVQEKVQRIDHMAFMGDVNVVFYEISHKVSSDHIDYPILVV
jgi:dsRNA-specific ribonuclease